MSNPRKRLRFRAVVGRWDISATKADYLGPDPGSRWPYGICLSDVDFLQGDVRLEVELPAPAPPDTSGRLLLDFKSDNDVYYTIGVGGYGKAYTLARYEMIHGWQALWLHGTESNLNNTRPHKLEVRYDGQKLRLTDHGSRIFDNPLRPALPDGQVGLFAWGNSVVRFSKAYVRGAEHTGAATDNQSAGGSIGRVIDALTSFGNTTRYLTARRRPRPLLKLSNEAQVQDALYMMLRPWVRDLVWEEPTGKSANLHAIKDFSSKSGRFAIEAKYIRNRAHGKSITAEINHDIETYRSDPHCDHLVFFIFDPNKHIPDGAALQRHVDTDRLYDGKSLRCYAIIQP